jgi:hypothetical protein
VKPGRSTGSARTQKQRRGPKPRKKWTKVNHSAVVQLVQASVSAGVLCPLPTSALPANLKQMPGAVSYYVSAYGSSLALSSNLTAGGEMAVVRTDAERAKAYNFIFATSSDGGYPRELRWVLTGSDGTSRSGEVQIL